MVKKYDTAGLPSEFFNPGELDVFLDLIATARPRVIVEFGVHRGRNAAAVLRNFDFVEKYVGIDVLPGHMPELRYQRHEIPATPGDLVNSPRFELILRPNGSHDLTPDDLPCADFYFIDGDHSAKGVINDRKLALATAREPESIILYHDDNGKPEVQVTETLAALRECGADIRHIDGTWFAIEGC